MQNYNLPTRLLDWTESILIALYFAVAEDDNNDGEVFALNARRLNRRNRLHDQNESYICGLNSIDVTVRSALASARRVKDLQYALRKDQSLQVIYEIGRREDGWDRTGIDAFIKWLNEELTDTDKYKKLMELLTSPVAVFPSRLNPRMTSQLSMVLIFGGKKGPTAARAETPRGERRLPAFEDDIHDLKLVAQGSDRFMKKFTVPSGSKADLREDLRRIGIHEAALFPDLEHVGNFVRREWSFPKT
jgi:hypothetical protein